MRTKRRVNFSEWITRLGLSFETKIGEIIVRAIENSYTSLGAKYAVSGAYQEATLIEMVQRIETKSKKSAVIYGTKVALAKLRSDKTGTWSEAEKDEFRTMGYVGNFYGTKVIEIPQSLNRKDEFMLNDKTLYVIPDGTKIVKLLFEGDVDVVETSDNKTRKDMQFEYMFMRRVQVGVCKSSVYGVYKLTA